jgi:bacillithiol biosynthesis deacetylase BshB1
MEGELVIMNILAVGAHPDDMEILCGGTLAKMSQQGHRVFIATMSNGDKGHLIIPPKELGKLRLKEAENAAHLLGAQHLYLGFKDAEVYRGEKTVMRIVEAVRTAKADIILTHHPEDYHPDHVNTAISVLDAAFNAGVPRIKTRHEAHTPKKVYLTETFFGLSFNPEIWIDISDTIDLKMKALAEHKSQVEWLKKHHGYDLLEAIRTCARYRGLQVGVEYAEVFSSAKKHMMIKPTNSFP